MTSEGHPIQLKDGTWGASVDAPSLKVGDTVEMVSRTGARWSVRVTEIVYDYQGKYLVKVGR